MAAPAMGPRIRKLREEAGLTAAELAQQADLSPSMLSQVERGIVSPSISSLRRIAGVLSVPAFYLLIEDDRLNGIVVRCHDRRTIKLPDHDAIYQLLSPSLDKRIEMIAFSLGPGEATCESPMAHEGEECLLLVSGRVRVVLPDQEIVLEAGDSIYFDRCLPHQLICIGDESAWAVCAISPPSY